MIKALIGSALNNQDKGGQIVKQEKPAMQPFVAEVERVKKESTSKPTSALLPPTFSVTKSDVKVGGAKPKGIRPKVKLASKKLRTLRNIFASRFKNIKGEQEQRRKNTEKERGERKENLFEKLKLPSLSGIAAPITRPFTSFFDQILDAVGKIVLALIGQWAIDNPEMFVGAIKGLEKALDTIANVFIIGIDLFSSIISGVERLEQGFGDFIKGTPFGDAALKQIEKMGGNLTQLFDASLLLGGLLLQYTLSELADSSGPGRRTGKEKPGKPTPVSQVSNKPTVKPTAKITTIQSSPIGSPQRRLAGKIQRQHGHAARRIFENKYDDLISQDKSPYQANKGAKAAVTRAISKKQIKSQPQTGTLLGRKPKPKLSIRQRIAQAPKQIRSSLSKQNIKQVAKTAPKNVADGLQQVFGKGMSRATQRFFIKVLGKGGVEGLKRGMSKIPVVGPLLVFALNWASGESILRSGAMAVGAGLGQLLGTWAGGAIGAIGGPLAPVTVPLSAFIGSMLGGMGGEFLGGWLYDLFIKTNENGSTSINSSGEIGKKFGSGVAQLFKKDWVKIGKGFVTWILKTLETGAKGVWGMMNSMAQFLGLKDLGSAFVQTIGKAFNGVSDFFKKMWSIRGFIGKLLNPFTHAMALMDLMNSPQVRKTFIDGFTNLWNGVKDFGSMLMNPIGFIIDKGVKPFLKNLNQLWNNRDKFWSFLTRRGTFQEVTGAISGAAGAAAGAAGSMAGSVSAGGFTTPSSDQSGIVTDPAVHGGKVGAGEMNLLQRLVLAEAAGEGVTGMALVARSVLNRAGLIQSGAVRPGMFLAKDKTVTGVIMGRNQYQPVTNGTINKQWGAGSMQKASEAIALSQNINKLKQTLKAEGISDSDINKLISSTGFRAGSAFNDPSQNVNVTKYKRHYFNTAGNSKMKALGANISTVSAPSPTPQEMIPPPPPILPPPQTQAQISPSQPSSGTAAATPSISQPAPYDSKAAGVPAFVPIPSAPSVPVGQSVPSSGGSSASPSTSWVLNQYYIQQLSAFLYKQG